MRAVVCREFGPPRSLVVEDREPLTAGPRQAVVRVEAAGVNYVDALFVAGEYQIKPRPPFVPGMEVAGTVTAVGDDVTTCAVGDRVMAMCGLGGFAEEVVLSADQLVAVPDVLELPRAAAFIQSYCTALFALRDRGRLQPGEWVLVLGAAGGVGQASIDVARVLGATVVAAASSPARVDEALSRGAAAGIDYTAEDLKTRAREVSGGGVDVVVDPVGGELSEAALRSLGYDGRFLVIGFAGGPIPSLRTNLVLLNNRNVVGVDWGAWALTHPREQRTLLGDLLAMVEAGRLHPVQPTTYPLERVADALEDLRNRRVTGKVVLVP
ncbi:MAG: NADPH:quinone oxidoreductase family protein [Acidimicrobiales bacterium]|nr:NADPH:quinone oxidoreductase family protein [Acidimicrobiales bacterium]